MGEARVKVMGPYITDPHRRVDSQPLIIGLNEIDGDRGCQLWSNFIQAGYLYLALNDKKPDHLEGPFTLINLLDKTGIEAAKVVISERIDNRYYASIYLRHSGSEIIIESKPTDAITVGIYYKVDIFVNELFLNQQEFIKEEQITPDVKNETTPQQMDENALSEWFKNLDPNTIPKE